MSSIPGTLAPQADRRRRLPRSVRFILGAVVCWGVLLGIAAAVVVVKDREAAAARMPYPAPHITLSAAQRAYWEAFPRYRNVIPVLTYHGIDPTQNYLTVTRDKFAQQMLALHLGGFHAVSLEQYVRYTHGDVRGLPQNPVLITFDDGRLDSYRAADAVLKEYGYTAVMFVVAAWPDTHPGFALHWNELVRMQQSGTWDIQMHAGTGHKHIVVNANGKMGEYYGYLSWIGSGPSGHLESFDSYKHRVTSDIEWGVEQLHSHIPGYRPLGFAVPYSNYGQRQSNDMAQIPRFFLSMARRHIAVVFDGDYLDEGKHRPDEVKGRFSPSLSYRITQGDVLKLRDLGCRLRDWTLQKPMWQEYRCLRLDSVPVPSSNED